MVEEYRELEEAESHSWRQAGDTVVVDVEGF
jgi:hypothetical protein